jgi:hypothetical protein
MICQQTPRTPPRNDKELLLQLTFQLANGQNLNERGLDILKREQGLLKDRQILTEKQVEITQRDSESLKYQAKVQGRKMKEISQRVDSNETQTNQNSARIYQNSARIDRLDVMCRTIERVIKKVGLELPGGESEDGTRRGGLFGDDEGDDLVDGGEESERNNALEFSSEGGTCE